MNNVSSGFNMWVNENKDKLLNMINLAIVYENTGEFVFGNKNTMYNNLSELINQLEKIESSIEIIDLITCNIKNEQKTMIDKLNRENTIQIRYSVDPTGNYNNGGDWILESHNINIKALYFNDNIKDFTAILGAIDYEEIAECLVCPPPSVPVPTSSNIKRQIRHNNTDVTFNGIEQRNKTKLAGYGNYRRSRNSAITFKDLMKQL